MTKEEEEEEERQEEKNESLSPQHCGSMSLESDGHGLYHLPSESPNASYLDTQNLFPHL